MKDDPLDERRGCVIESLLRLSGSSVSFQNCAEEKQQPALMRREELRFLIAEDNRRVLKSLRLEIFFDARSGRSSRLNSKLTRRIGGKVKNVPEKMKEHRGKENGKRGG